MTDMLIRLYDLVQARVTEQQLKEEDVAVRRAMPFEREAIVQWVKRAFGPQWADVSLYVF